MGGVIGTGGAPGGSGGDLGQCEVPQGAARAGEGFDLDAARAHPLGGNYSGVPFNLADLDEDGALDAVAALTQGGRIATLRGSHDAVFAPVVDLVIPNASSAVVKELTGDAHADLLVLNPAAGGTTTRLFPGNGDGTFAQAPLPFFPATRSSPVFADLVGDESLDVLVRYEAYPYTYVEVYENAAGVPSLRAQLGLSVAASGMVFTAADVNGDDLLDVVVMGENGAERRMQIFPGQPNDTFGAAITHNLSNIVGNVLLRAPTSISVGDVNEDGADDFLVGDSAGANLYLGAGNHTPVYSRRFDLPRISRAVLADADGDAHVDVVLLSGDDALLHIRYGAGNGAFSEPVEWSTGDSSTQIAVADVDGDGDPDVVVNGGALNVLEQVAPRRYDALRVVTRGTAPGAVRLGDLDHDGHLDLLLLETTKVSVALGDGQGGFGEKRSAVVPFDPLYAELFHADGDEHLDVVISGKEGEVALYVGDGAGGLSLVDATPFGRMVAVADLDEDGKMDFLTADYRNVRLHRGDGQGNFDVEVLDDQGSSNTQLAVADVVGDEHLDVIVAGWETRDVRIFEGDGQGHVTLVDTLSLASDVAHVIAADFTGDCRGDLLVGQFTAYLSTILHATLPSGAFEAQPAFLTSYTTEQKAADFDGDGWLDFIHMHHSASCVIGFNAGDGTFARSSFPCDGSRRVAIGDLDDDGRPDFVLSNDTNGYVTVGMNRSTFADPD